MELLVGVHIGGDYNPGINAAKISLDDDRIQEIIKLSKQVNKNGYGYITAYDSTPDLGTSDLNLEDQQIKDIAKLSEEESQQAVFGALSSEGRSEIVQLHVDSTDFWWEGVFKHTDVHWETRLIPLSLLPEVKATPKKKSDLDMTPEQMNAIHEKISAGINSGLNASEIADTFNRHITKAQLVRVIWELLERDH